MFSLIAAIVSYRRQFEAGQRIAAPMLAKHARRVANDASITQVARAA